MSDGTRSENTRPKRNAWLGDILAGFSVALVLIPQCLAYAELAGLPAYYGLYAATIPPIVAAFFASSPYLQTGPTALTSILTFGILASMFNRGSSEFVAAAALLTLVVGVSRLLIGLVRFGAVAYAMSQPIMRGFTSAAAILILSSQFPTAVGVSPPGASVFSDVWWTLSHINHWNITAVILCAITLALMLGGRRISAFFPGVLIAVITGLLISWQLHYTGPVIGNINLQFQGLEFAVPWSALPSLVLGGVVIAVIGFAEVSAIARTFAGEERTRWDPNREFVSQGVANIASGLIGGFPVGGSFSRSSLNRLSGAKTRWSGLFAGLFVIAFLPFASVLSSLPKAVLAGIVIGAVLNLLKLRSLLRLWRYARLQALTAYGTFALTLFFAPRIDYAVIAGVGLAIAAHLWRESKLGIEIEKTADSTQISLSGVLWFGSVKQCEDAFRQLLSSELPGKTLIIDGEGLGRVDLSGAMLLADVIEDAKAQGIRVKVEGLQDYMQRVLERVQQGRAHP